MERNVTVKAAARSAWNLEVKVFESLSSDMFTGKSKSCAEGRIVVRWVRLDRVPRARHASAQRILERCPTVGAVF